MSTNTNTEKVCGGRGDVGGENANANAGAAGAAGALRTLRLMGAGAGGEGEQRAREWERAHTSPRVSLHCWTARGYPCYSGVFQTKTAARRTARQLVRDGYAFSYDIR